MSGMSRHIFVVLAVLALLNGAGLASGARSSQTEHADEKAEREVAKEERREAKSDERGTKRDARDGERDANREEKSDPPPRAPAVPTPVPSIPSAQPSPAPSETPRAELAGAPSILADATVAAPAVEPGVPLSTSARPYKAFTPLPAEDLRDTDASTIGAGAAPAAAPAWAPLPEPPTDTSASPLWHRLLWGLPMLGLGGAAAVLMSRQRARSREDTVAVTPRATEAPRDLAGLLKHGNAAVARGALEDAIACFDRALRLAPTLAVAHFCKGVCLAASGRAAEAYGALDAAVRVAPEDASYRIHLARVALTLGKTKAAMDTLQPVALAAPELGPAMLDDPQLAGLRDHPRFLMMCGAL